jgi:pyruvate formate lyase activating enzyme
MTDSDAPRFSASVPARDDGLHASVLLLDIERMSTENGPGLRTTAFFKGCNLACPWCHNPESISRKPEIVWFPRKCMGCNICRDHCPHKAISRDEGGIHFDRSLCDVCGACAEECPNAAMEIKGKTMPVAELAGTLAKDKAYFGADGGITLSGGEAMLQHEAAKELARLLKAAGLSVALDTAGCFGYQRMEDILPYLDLVLYDIKIFDNAEHSRLVGADNSAVLGTYRKLAASNTRVWVRTPIIPGATDSEENISAIGKFLASVGLPEKWELCAFNNLCKDKYARLDREWAYANAGLIEKKHIEKLTEIAARHVPSAVYSGTVKE